MPQIKWDTKLYNDKHSFVTRYGEDLIGWLHPQKGERILDLGSGTGQLTFEISESGAEVIGIDNSPQMIAKAKATYPSLKFEVRDAINFQFDEKFDAVFSNATLHWINDQQNTIKCVYNNLKVGGRFVFEMGGKRNIESISNAIEKAMMDEGFEDKLTKDFWFYPSVAEYALLLEQQGFMVTSALYFDRETPLTGEDGMKDWINMFASFLFKKLSKERAEKVIAKALEYLRPANYLNYIWYADYVRLRMKAMKPHFLKRTRAKKKLNKII
jgi:trans-aconitate methyltransferase